MLLPIFLILLGIACLYWGGELLVDNSIRLAQSLGVSKMVIGLTVVAFGTSCPELAASLIAVFDDSPDLAVANAFGSNVANLGLILGISALLLPFTVTVAFLRREVAFMIFVTLLIYPLAVDGHLSRLDGAILMTLLIVFIFVLLRSSDSNDEHMVPSDGELDKTPRPVWLSALGVALGIAVLVGGAKSLISGAKTVAEAFGVPELVIGFTVVALGTSLPELAASVIAVRKGEGDIVMGNLIGSNIFNLLCILGMTSLIVPFSVNPVAMGSDYGVMLGISVLLMIFLALDRKLNRIEGAVLLLVYLAYSVFLIVERGAGSNVVG